MGEHGNKTAVLLGIERYRELLDAREELETLRAYDEAKASANQAVPFAQAVRDREVDEKNPCEQE